MSLALQNTSQADEVANIAKKAQDTNCDDFRVKVFRRASPGAAMESLAVLDGARVEHFATPEPWLMALFGAGPIFVLLAYHATDLNTPIATVIPAAMNGKPLDEVQAHVMSAPGWNGPTKLTFAMRIAPEPKKQPARADPFNPFGSGSPSVEGRAANVAPVEAGAAPDSSYIARQLAALQSEREQLREQRVLAQIEETRREAERAAKRTEEKLAAAIDSLKATVATRPADAAPSKGLDVVALVGAFAPVLTSLLGAQREDRKHRDEIEVRREEREARAREEQAKRESAMLERIASQSAETAKVFASQTEMIGAMSRTVVQTIAAMQEIAAPAPQENDMIGLVKAGLGAFAEYAAMARTAAAQRGGPPGVTDPKLQPDRQPAPAAPPAAGFGDAAQGAPEGAVEIKDADPEDVLNEIESMLKGHADPREAAETYLEAMTTNPGVPPFVQGSGGTVGFFQKRLGAEWLNVPENVAYVQKVLFALQQVAKEHGIRAA